MRITSRTVSRWLFKLPGVWGFREPCSDHADKHSINFLRKSSCNPLTMATGLAWSTQDFLKRILYPIRSMRMNCLVIDINVSTRNVSIFLRYVPRARKSKRDEKSTAFWKYKSFPRNSYSRIIDPCYKSILMIPSSAIASPIVVKSLTACF